MRVMILCADYEPQWLRIPKYLLPCYNGMLFEDVLSKAPSGLVVSTNPVIITRTRQIFTPPHHEYISRAISSTMPLWRDYNVLLLGDAYYSPKDIQSILEPPGGLSVEFWGRECAELGYPQGHIMAMAWRSGVKAIEDGLRRAARWCQLGWCPDNMHAIHNAILDFAPNDHIIAPARHNTLSADTASWYSLKEYKVWLANHKAS